MKTLMKLTLVIFAALSFSHLAQAESKAVSKESALEQMEKMKQEMMDLQDIIGETNDSQGNLSAAGQMIDMVAEDMDEVKKLDSASDQEQIVDNLEDVADMRDTVKAMTTK